MIQERVFVVVVFGQVPAREECYDPGKSICCCMLEANVMIQETVCCCCMLEANVMIQK